jgi:hypothetical protein
MNGSSTTQTPETVRTIEVRRRNPRWDAGKAWITSVFIWEWDKLNSAGQNKSLQSSYWFLLAVPVLAKLLSKLPSDVTVSLGGKPVDVHIALPFSWVALFFCALFVSVGNAIYSLYCPRIVKWFRDFKEYTESGRGIPFLNTQLEILARVERGFSGRLPAPDALASLAGRGFKVPILSDDEFQQFRNELAYGSRQGGFVLTGNTFHLIRDLATQTRPRARAIASVSYLIGFALLGIIIIQNIVFVIQYLWARS